MKPNALRNVKRSMAGKTLLLIAVLILFLFLNWGACESRVDDYIEPDKYELENPYVKLEYDPERNTFEILNRDNGRIYRTEPVKSYDTVEVKVRSRTRMEITTRLKSEHGDFSVVSEISLEDKRIKGIMKAPGDASLRNPIPFPGAISGSEEKQYFAIPYAEGIYVPANEKGDFGDFQMWGHKSTMPFTGMTDSKTGIMITSDTPADTSIGFVKPQASNSDNYLMQLSHCAAKGKFGYDRVFYIDFIERDGYNEMAKIFRKHLEKKQAYKAFEDPDALVTLKQKLEKNGNVEKLVGAVDFWLGPLDMKSTGVIDELADNGVRKAVVNFQYGWKVYEEEKRPEVVQYVSDKGMIPSRYDSFSDIFDPAVQSISPRYRTDGFRERVIIKENGGFQEGHESYNKGQKVQGYRLNSKFSVEDVDGYLGSDLKENSYLGRFIDVAASSRLYEDYSGSHPMTRSEDLLNRYKLMEKVSSGYGMVTGAEETTWWAVPVTHYSEGTMTIVPPDGSGNDWSTPVENPGNLYEKYTVNPAVRIPLKSLVYHDCHVSGWYTGDGISKVMRYWKTKELLTLLYGTMNLVFPPDRDFWERYKDRFLWSIKSTAWVFEKVGYEEMERHEFLSSDGQLQKTQFSNGVKIIVNFSDSTRHYGPVSVPARDFIVLRGLWVYTSDWIADMVSAGKN